MEDRAKKRPHPIKDEAAMIRRGRQAQILKELSQNLPLSPEHIAKASQGTLLGIAVNYIKIRNILEDTFKATFPSSATLPLVFGGFVLVIDLKGQIMFASKSIESLLGPRVADCIAQPFTSLLHKEDRTKLEKVLLSKNVDIRKEHILVVRMKIALSPVLRSESRMEYKKVLITCNFKDHWLMNCWNEKEKITVAILLCRTDDLLGFPEIHLSHKITTRINPRTWQFISLEDTGQWLTGFKTETAIGMSPMSFKHPGDERGGDKKAFAAKLFSGETFRFPNKRHRILTAWGHWIWILTEFTGEFGENKRMASIRMDVFPLGPVDEPTCCNQGRSTKVCKDKDFGTSVKCSPQPDSDYKSDSSHSPSSSMITSPSSFNGSSVSSGNPPNTAIPQPLSSPSSYEVSYPGNYVASSPGNYEASYPGNYEASSPGNYEVSSGNYVVSNPVVSSGNYEVSPGNYVVSPGNYVVSNPKSTAYPVSGLPYKSHSPFGNSGVQYPISVSNSTALASYLGTPSSHASHLYQHGKYPFDGSKHLPYSNTCAVQTEGRKTHSSYVAIDPIEKMLNDF